MTALAQGDVLEDLRNARATEEGYNRPTPPVDGILMFARRMTCLVLMAALAGCATVLTLSQARVEEEMSFHPSGPRSFPRIYSGVLVDGYCLGVLADPMLLCLIDLPLSLAGDTLVLPYKAYQQVRYGNYHSRRAGQTPDAGETDADNADAGSP